MRRRRDRHRSASPSPLGNAVDVAAGGAAVGGEPSHGVVGVDAVGPTAVGDDLAVVRQGGELVVESVGWHRDRAGETAGAVLACKPDGRRGRGSGPRGDPSPTTRRSQRTGPAHAVVHTAQAPMNASKDDPCLALGPAERRAPASHSRQRRRHRHPNPSNRLLLQRPSIRSVRRNSLSSRQTAYLKIVVSAVRPRP